jgi:hypothetical protein
MCSQYLREIYGIFGIKPARHPIRGRYPHKSGNAFAYPAFLSNRQFQPEACPVFKMNRHIHPRDGCLKVKGIR